MKQGDSLGQGSEGQQAALIAQEVDRFFFNPTDQGLAQLYHALFGKNYLHAAGLGLLRWDGARWARDTAQGSRKDAMIVGHLVRQAYLSRGAFDVDRPGNRRAQSRTGIEAALSLLSAMVSIDPGKLDAAPMLLNVHNGTLNLKTGVLQPHDRADGLTRFVPVEYDSGASCPKWESFVSAVTSGNPETAAFLQRAVGYSLTGGSSEQCLFFLHGVGANGKGVLVRMLAKLLGDYAGNAPRGFLEQRFNLPHGTFLASLAGCRIVTATEVSQGVRWDEAFVKGLTGEDAQTANLMRQDPVTFTPRFKLWIGGNHRPVLRGTDDGIWRRIRLVPFLQCFKSREEMGPGDLEKNFDLEDELDRELPGILVWAVEGCRKWQRDGLGQAAEVQDATKEYRVESDTFGRFLEEEAVLSSLRTALTSEIAASYLAWALRTGAERLTPKAISAELRRRRFVEKHSANGTRWRGIGVGFAVEDSKASLNGGGVSCP